MPTYGGVGIGPFSTFRAFSGIYSEGGFQSLYKGTLPTTVRAALLAAAQLASYDHTKFVIKSNGLMEDGVPLHVVASLVSGFSATTAAAPADLIKTRVMADRSVSVAACIAKTWRAEGLRGFFRGWTPSYLRLGPHFIIAFPLYEQVRNAMGLGYM